ncbi:hypothetical protein [Catelliglobosispora koreensis]|uniref:hypothetical protein n=1 Tax=Catelliglobosispora koreensis TaxID=129052 RepID=UPI000360A2EB|nr:hypothetical protein [Catelliglobosispora koreensis]
MSEDVVEFGGATPRERRPSRIKITVPKLPFPVGYAFAGGAAVAALASLTMTWQTATYTPPGGNGNATPSAPDRAMLYNFDSTTFGLVYIFALLAVAVTIVLAMRGEGPVRTNARLAGLTCCGFAAALIALAVYSVSKYPDRTGALYGLSSEIAELYTVRLTWGIYAAMATVLLSIGALMFSAVEPAEVIDRPVLYDAGEYEDEADDLTVVVEETKPVSASHELYMRK